MCHCRDAIIIAGGDTMISIFAGIVIFAFIGYMAHIMDVKVSDVATTGANSNHDSYFACSFDLE